MKSYIGTGLASLAVIFCVTVLADDPDGRKPTNRSRGGDERRTDQRSQSKSSQSHGSQSRSSQKRSSQSKGKAQNRGGDNNNRRDMDMGAIRKRIGAGVKSGKIKREDAAKMLEDLRKRGDQARGERVNNNARERKSRSNARPDFEALLRQRIEGELKKAFGEGKPSEEDARNRPAEIARDGEDGADDQRYVKYLRIHRCAVVISPKRKPGEDAHALEHIGNDDGNREIAQDAALAVATSAVQ